MSEVVVEELNRLYKTDPAKHAKECSTLKKLGYRIFINENGEHKVIDPPKKQETNIFGNTEFGYIFNNIFNIIGTASGLIINKNYMNKTQIFSTK